MTCYHVTQHLLNGVLPIGRTYEHQCGDCKARWTTESVGRSLYNLFFGGLWLLFGAGGTAFVVAWAIDFAAGRSGLPSLYQAAMGALMLAMLGAGIYVPVRTVQRNVRLFRNPVVG